MRGKITKFTYSDFLVGCATCDEQDLYDHALAREKITTARKFETMLRKLGWKKSKGLWFCPKCAQETK